MSQLAPETAILCEVTWDGGHSAVQGHSRSPMLVPIKSPYATSYWWIILTCVCLVLFLSYHGVLAKLLILTRDASISLPCSGVSPRTLDCNISHQKT